MKCVREVHFCGLKPAFTRGVQGHGPPEKFRNLDTLRLVLVHSEPISTAIY